MSALVLRGKDGTTFIITGYARELADGRFGASYVVTAERGDHAEDHRHDSADVFADSGDAAFRGAELGAAYVARRHDLAG